MSMMRNYANPIRKFGSDEFISFKVLLDSSLGYVDNGSIKFIIKVLTLKETISKDREELNNVYRLDLSGEFVIWRVDNFLAFIDFLGVGLNIESQSFEVHGCEHRMVILVNGIICASLKCEKAQKDFVYKVGLWNREEIVFAISTTLQFA
ncbi:uncharacterized protein LOC131306835 [Rhododendron vialii]|uniref:uncharacterized protein LOC131306835 n=1 Tax=Rhododendron vialii TaxID=182163 RepID=UPI00265E22A3|nr:uncharacterized protein LOC131306835 [Rhododendron vialii]